LSQYQLATFWHKNKVSEPVSRQITGILILICANFLKFHRTDIDRLIDQILLEEPLISEGKKPQLKKLIEKLIEKQQENQE
jgi:dynein assembly factor with WDR repeat domains 1